LQHGVGGGGDLGPVRIPGELVETRRSDLPGETVLSAFRANPVAPSRVEESLVAGKHRPKGRRLSGETRCGEEVPRRRSG
jgi:hypothetical protein